MFKRQDVPWEPKDPFYLRCWELHAPRLAARFPDALFVLLAGTECTDTSRGMQTFRRPGSTWGLHASRGRTFCIPVHGTWRAGLVCIEYAIWNFHHVPRPMMQMISTGTRGGHWWPKGSNSGAPPATDGNS